MVPEGNLGDGVRIPAMSQFDAPCGVEPLTLRVRVLGELAVDGISTRTLGSRKARVVLKVLALQHGRSVSVDRLVEAVWPDALPAEPAAQLAVLVSRLRAALGRRRIRQGDAGYRLELDWLDLDKFNELASLTDAAASDGHLVEAFEAARSALELARDPLLAEDIDAPWARSARHVVERTVARLRRFASGTALALGRVEEAADIATAAIEADAYDEVSLRHLMLAEQRRGCTAAGLVAYAKLRADLAEELGVDPSGETEAVYLALLRDGELGRASAVPLRAREEASDTSFRLVGREVELAVLVRELELVSLGDSRLVVIEGEAGIGKSELLRAFRRQATDDGALWVFGTCEPLFLELPMQSVVDALSGYVATLSRVETATLLAGDHQTLGPLLDPASPARFEGWSDASSESWRLFQGFDTVLGRMTMTRIVVLAIDDVHRAGPSTVELLAYFRRRRRRLLIVVTRRPLEGPSITADTVVSLGPLRVEDAVALFGPERGPMLHNRAAGNPLFLAQLASGAPGAALPASLVEAVVDVADGLGVAKAIVMDAAVLGPRVDVDLLAEVLRMPPLELSAHLDVARDRRLLDSTDDGYAFRHLLVRDALADASTPARAALLHRETARVLRARGLADPLEVAHHARLGGDLELAADALEEGAAAATQRFDRGAAEDLLDQALRWSDAPARRLARARTRTMRGRYNAALDDVAAAIAGGAGAAALEAGAWAAYFARRFDESRSFADDGVALAQGPALRASCLSVAGRVRHASGDLAGAEPLLQEAVLLADGPARAVPTVWLGVLRSHQSRPREALELLRQITRVEAGAERTTELLHALLFTAHAHALQCQPLEALDALHRYDFELDRRHVPRFLGRASNFRGWVLRALGQWDRADDANREAADQLASVDFPETLIASSLDLASSSLLRNDATDAAEQLRRAGAMLTTQLTFGWRLDLRLRLERARLALLVDEPINAVEAAARVARDASQLGVERYATVARLVEARARVRLGETPDFGAIERDLDALDVAVGIDSWWVTAEVARDFSMPAWRDRALTRAALLARSAGAENNELGRAVASLFG